MKNGSRKLWAALCFTISAWLLLQWLSAVFFLHRTAPSMDGHIAGHSSIAQLTKGRSVSGADADDVDTDGRDGTDLGRVNATVVPSKIAFVHIGKTGGETIKWRLRMVCDLRKSQRKRARCLEQFETGQSELSKHVTAYMHCNAMRPKLGIPNATAFMISVRDPISRIVSWFQYMHPRNCLPDRPSAACNLKKKDSDGYQWGQDFFQTCFPTIDDVAQSLRISRVVPRRQHDDDKDVDVHVDCSALARDAIQGSGPEGPSNHLFFNYKYYADRTMQPHPSTPIFVVRQEFIWADMRRIETMLGGDSHHPFETEGPVITHGTELFPYKSELSAHLASFVCCAMLNEIETYANIVEASMNLNGNERAQTIQMTMDRCNADSYEQLKQMC